MTCLEENLGILSSSTSVVTKFNTYKKMQSNNIKTKTMINMLKGK